MAEIQDPKNEKAFKDCINAVRTYVRLRTKRHKLLLFVCIAGRHRSTAMQILTGCALQACDAVIGRFELLSYPDWKTRGCKVERCKTCCLQTRQDEVDIIKHIIEAVGIFCGDKGYLPSMVSRIMTCADYSKKFWQGDDSRENLKLVCVRDCEEPPDFSDEKRTYFEIRQWKRLSTESREKSSIFYIGPAAKLTGTRKIKDTPEFKVDEGDIDSDSGEKETRGRVENLGHLGLSLIHI